MISFLAAIMTAKQPELDNMILYMLTTHFFFSKINHIFSFLIIKQMKKIFAMCLMYEFE